MDEMKGQGSTEYLVIVSVVLVVTLMVAGLIGQIIPVGGEAKIEQSRSYWRSTAPLSIQNIKISGTEVQISMRNQLNQEIVLNNVSFDGIDLGIAETNVPPGISTIVSGNIGTNCNTGAQYEYQNVTFIYSQGPVGGLTQTGDKALMGTCN